LTSFRGQASRAKMTSPGGKLTALACHLTKKVNKAEELTNLSTNIVFTYVPNNQWIPKLNLDANLEVLLCMSL
jgi:hypothetical protein